MAGTILVLLLAHLLTTGYDCYSNTGKYTVVDKNDMEQDSGYVRMSPGLTSDYTEVEIPAQTEAKRTGGSALEIDWKVYSPSCWLGKHTLVENCVTIERIPTPQDETVVRYRVTKNPNVDIPPGAHATLSCRGEYLTNRGIKIGTRIEVPIRFR